MITFMLVCDIFLAHIIQIKFGQHHKILMPLLTRVVLRLCWHFLLRAQWRSPGGPKYNIGSWFPSWSCDYVARDHIVSFWSNFDPQWPQWHWLHGCICYNSAKCHTKTIFTQPVPNGLPAGRRKRQRVQLIEVDLLDWLDNFCLPLTGDLLRWTNRNDGSTKHLNSQIHLNRGASFVTFEGC